MSDTDSAPISQVPTIVPAGCEVCDGSGAVKGTAGQLVTYCECHAGARLKSASEKRLPKIAAEKAAKRIGLTGVNDNSRVVRVDRTCLNCRAEKPTACHRCKGDRVSVVVIRNGSGWR